MTGSNDELDDAALTQVTGGTGPNSGLVQDSSLGVAYLSYEAHAQSSIKSSTAASKVDKDLTKQLDDAIDGSLMRLTNSNDRMASMLNDIHKGRTEDRGGMNPFRR